MEWLILTAVVAAIIWGILAWRFKACLKRRRPLNPESTWVIYAAPILGYDMFRSFVPNAETAVSVVVLVALTALAWFAATRVTKLYDRRLKAVLEADGKTGEAQ